ncbi:cobalt ECF transporter T component CbiQ [Pseudomonadota bacterium]
MALDIDRHAHVESAIQRWDPRYKIVGLFTLIFSIALLKSIPLVMIGLVISVVLLLLSRIPLDFVYGGMKLVVIFLLPFFLILPLSYPGETSFELLGMSFAMEGLRLSVLIVVKAIAIVLIAYAIFGSRRFDINMIALQHLKCPSVVVQMMLFTYRYIFLFLQEMRRMDTAMKARGFEKKPNMYTLKVMGGFVGTLLVRSFERTERIYKAMLSKGYNGEFHTLVEFNADSKDIIKTVLVLSVAIALFSTDLTSLFAHAEQGWY